VVSRTREAIASALSGVFAGSNGAHGPESSGAPTCAPDRHSVLWTHTWPLYPGRFGLSTGATMGRAGIEPATLGLKVDASGS
jgi:hypothetical protein